MIVDNVRGLAGITVGASTDSKDLRVIEAAVRGQNARAAGFSRGDCVP